MTVMYLTIVNLVARQGQLLLATQSPTKKVPNSSAQNKCSRLCATGSRVCSLLQNYTFLQKKKEKKEKRKKKKIIIGSFASVQSDAQSCLCRYLCHPPRPSAEPHKHKAVCALTANKQQFTRRLTTEEYTQIPKHRIEGQH